MKITCSVTAGVITRNYVTRTYVQNVIDSLDPRSRYAERRRRVQGANEGVPRDLTPFGLQSSSKIVGHLAA